MINFFNMGNLDQRLVDLPGYGYAAVPEAMKKEWQSELEKYLISRKSLAGLVLLTDIRHPLKLFDEQMLHWAKDGELEVHVLLTKADKLKKSQLAKTLEDFENLCRPYGCQKVVLTSGENGYGIPELQAVLNAAVAGEQEAE